MTAKPDGPNSEIPFSWHGRPAVLSLVNDITDRKRAEEALARSERKYRKLVETIDEGIGALDKDGKLVFFNPRPGDMMGYSVEEMEGKDLFQLLSFRTDDRGVKTTARRLDGRREGIGERYEADGIRRDGTTIHVSVSASPILDEHGQYAGSIAAVQDITDRKKAQESLTESERHYRRVAGAVRRWEPLADGRLRVELNLREDEGPIATAKELLIAAGVDEARVPLVRVTRERLVLRPRTPAACSPADAFQDESATEGEP